MVLSRQKGEKIIMVMSGETIQTGASQKCSECKTTVSPKVCRSPAGFYVGTVCKCGPYTRESGYYTTFDDAENALNQGTYKRI
jgi:hypothetical protein